MPKRVTRSGVHLRGLAPGQHSNVPGWQAVGDAVFDVAGSEIKPCTYHTVSDVSNHYASHLTDNNNIFKYESKREFSHQKSENSFSKIAFMIQKFVALF